MRPLIRSFVLCAGLLSCAAVTQAAQIVFTLDCRVVDASTCTSAGPFGTLTLTDSVIDPTRVDLDLVITTPTSATFQGIDEFFLNFDTVTGPSLTGRQFRVVPVSTPAGNNGTTFVTLTATTSYSSDSLGPPSTANTLDLSINPSNPPASPITTFTGSLLLRTSASGGINTTQWNLDASMFDLVSPTSLLYAAVEGVPAGPNQLEVGAKTSDHGIVTAVPEPGSLLLFGTGMLSIGAWVRRRRS
jgi:hypothetical protein